MALFIAIIILHYPLLWKLDFKYSHLDKFSKNLTEYSKKSRVNGSTKIKELWGKRTKDTGITT